MSWLSFRFLYPWILALIPVLLIIYGFKSHQLKKINQPARLKMSSLPEINQKRGHWIRTFLTDPMRVSFFLRALTLFFIIIALARPQRPSSTQDRMVSGVDILLVMDVSASMDIVDMSEESRFEVAKKTLKEFVLSRSHDRVGLVVFSGEPLTLVPPTMDTGILLKSLADVEIGVLKDGTAIGDGLSVGVNRLKSVKAKSKVIVLLTDGDNNVGQIDPLVAGELAQGYGIKVYTIAIGKEGRVKVPIRRRGMGGNSVVTYQWQENALNTELLEKISKITQAKFYRVEDQNTLQKVFKEIDQLEPSLMPQKEKILYDEMFHRPLLWALWTLMLSLLFSFWRWGILL